MPGIPHKSLIARLITEFRKTYDSRPRLFYAPGRVNLIGEHTDYNDGFVLPVAIDRGTLVAAASREDRRIRVRSLNLNESAQFDLDHPWPGQRGVWLDYVEGVARSLESGCAFLRGADIAILSDVALGAGLSSSAALEISLGIALVALCGKEIDRQEVALAAQRAEHHYVGIKSGIMDQYIGVYGKKDHGLLIDCRSLEHTLVPLNLSDLALVVCDTGVKHSLAASEYNTRRAECEGGVRLLQKELPGIRALRDISVAEFRHVEHRLPEPIRRRCRHVITENQRTLEAAEALKSGDFEKMGSLMADSHRSLRDDYEVSCLELDLLVDSAQECEGLTGARMTGGGFGGCTVNLVRREALSRFQEHVARKYRHATQREAAIFVVEASDSARELLV